MSELLRRIEDTVRELSWIRKLTVPEILEFEIVVHKPDRIVIDPSGVKGRKFPLLEARAVDPSGYCEKIAEIRLVEPLDIGGRLMYGKIMFKRRGEAREVPVTLSYGCEVRVDLTTVPLNIYLYLLAIAEALKLPYVMWHRAYALVAKPGARKTLFLVLILNILHELIKLVVELYEAVKELAEKGMDVKAVQSIVTTTVANVLDSLLFTRSGISEINNLIRQYVAVPENLILYAPTCDVCGRRVEGMLIPGDLAREVDDIHEVTLEDLNYAVKIIDTLRRNNIPILCRSCRFKLREKLSRLYKECEGKEIDVSKLMKIALDEIRKEVRRFRQ